MIHLTFLTVVIMILAPSRVGSRSTCSGISNGQRLFMIWASRHSGQRCVAHPPQAVVAREGGGAVGVCGGIERGKVLLLLGVAGPAGKRGAPLRGQVLGPGMGAARI